MLLEDQLQIKATPERVWQVTIDVETWPKWSPAMQKILREDAGEFRVGSSALIKQKAMPETRWTVTKCVPGKEFSWQARLPGMEMVATHRIESEKEGVTSYLSVKMTGWAVTLFGLLLRGPVQKSLKEENLGLKRFCESSD